MKNVSLSKFTRVALPVIVCVLFAVWIVPLVQKSSQRSQRSICLSRMRKVGVALQTYLNDNDGGWPTNEAWKTGAQSLRGLQGCPAAEPMPNLPGLKASGVPGYAYNALLGSGRRSGRYASIIPDVPMTATDILYPATTVSVCESAIGISTLQTADPYNNYGVHPTVIEKGWKRHADGGHYLFCDGHAAWFPDKAVQGFEDYVHAGNTGMIPTFAIAAPLAPPSGQSNKR